MDTTSSIGLIPPPEAMIQIGRSYQAEIPPLNSKDHPAFKAEKESSTLFWTPANNLKEEDVEKFVSTARANFGLQEDQALGLLMFNGFNLKRALDDFKNYDQVPRMELNREEKAIFGYAISIHGTNFRKIAELLPYYSVSSLVQYYYQRKINVKQGEYGANTTVLKKSPTTNYHISRSQVSYPTTFKRKLERMKE